jgi:hypothetical protein
LERRLRGLGRIGAAAAILGLLGSLLVSVGYLGVSSLRITWISGLPWLVVLGIAVFSISQRGSRSVAAVFGMVTSAVVFAGPTVLIAMNNIRWYQTPYDTWGNVMFSDWTSDFSSTLVIIGLVALFFAGAFFLYAGFRVCLAAARLPTGLVPKTPYRIEALSLILVIFFVGLLLNTPTDYGDSFTIYAGGGLILLLAWLIPLSLVLTFTLRQPGAASLWVTGSLIGSLLIEPVFRSVLVNFLSNEKTTESMSLYVQSGFGNTGSALVPTLFSAWVIIPVMILAIVVILWNSAPEPPTQIPNAAAYTAPIDNWAAGSFVLAFVPFLSVPAIALGHISYERVLSCNGLVRGRIFAASAIVLGILNIASVVLIVSGVVRSVSDLAFWS